MNNPYRVKTENNIIIKRGYLCPICGEYGKRPECDCKKASDNTVDQVIEKVKSKKAKKSKIKDLGADDE